MVEAVLTNDAAAFGFPTHHQGLQLLNASTEALLTSSCHGQLFIEEAH